MDFLKFLPASSLLGFLPMILIKVGNAFKNKDDNTTGFDDTFGTLLINVAPAVEAADGGNETAKKKAMLVAYNTIGAYLGKPAVK